MLQEHPSNLCRPLKVGPECSPLLSSPEKFPTALSRSRTAMAAWVVSIMSIMVIKVVMRGYSLCYLITTAPSISILLSESIVD